MPGETTTVGPMTQIAAVVWTAIVENLPRDLTWPWLLLMIRNRKLTSAGQEQ